MRDPIENISHLPIHKILKLQKMMRVQSKKIAMELMGLTFGKGF